MDFKKATDEELTQEAQAGLRGQGALAEMMNRLKDSIINAEKSTSQLNRRLLHFTIVIALLTALQVILLIVQAFRN